MQDNLIQDISDKNKKKKNLLSLGELNNKEFFSKHDDSRNKVKFLSRKILRFKTIKEDKKTLNSNDNEVGRWTKEEKEKFIEGLSLYDTNWKKFTKLIQSRNLVQIRSHAQKFFIKLKNYKNSQLGIDFTSDSVNSLKDMINQIKSINRNFNIKNLFLLISKQCSQIKRNKNGNMNKISNKIYNKGPVRKII